jgi:hypothetical protein
MNFFRAEINIRQRVGIFNFLSADSSFVVFYYTVNTLAKYSSKVFACSTEPAIKLLSPPAF